MPRQNRTLITVLGGMLLLLAAGTTWWLLRGSGGQQAPGNVLLVPQPARPSTGAELLAPVARIETAPSVGLVAVNAAPASDAAPKMPESFRRALGALTGRVVESDGSPIADMKIELAGGNKSLVNRAADAFLQPGGLDFFPIAGAAVTAADGRFTLAELEPRTFGVLLLDPGGPRALMHLLEMTPVSGATTDLGDIVVPPFVTLTGHVVDERSQPVAGARVRATIVPFGGMPSADTVMSSLADVRKGSAVLVPQGTQGSDHDVVFALPPSIEELEGHLPIPTTTTTVDGNFALPGVSPGLVLLAVDDGVHLPLVNMSVPTGAAGGTRDLGTLTVGDGLTLHGFVLDGKGKPVAGAEVLAGNTVVMAPVALLKGPQRTGADGAFTVTGLRDGTVYAAARADSRHEYTTASLPDAATGTLTVTLAGPRQLTVTVLDEHTQPVAGAAFWGRSVDDAEVPDFFLPPHALADHVSVDAGGRYVISELNPAKWQIIVRAEGYGQERFMADLAGGDTTAEVSLKAGSALVVRVVRASDQSPVEYARVDAFPGEESFGNLLTSSRTDAEGRARLRDLPPGVVKLEVTHPALAVTSVETTAPNADEVLVPLLPGAAIAGSVIDHGGPPAEFLLVMLETHGAPGDAELPRSTVTDVHGAFRFERVEPGHAHLEARSRHEIESGFSMLESFFNSPLAEADVDVPADGEARAVLLVGGSGDVETGFVSGHVSVNGLPGSGWKVRTWGQIRRSTTADERGDFDLGSVEAGKVNLMLSAPGSSLMQGYTQSTEVDVARDEHKFVNITFATGSIAGHVASAANGSPLRGASVQAIDAAQERSGWGRQNSAVTDAAGNFAIEPVVAGSYRLNARAEGYANTTSNAVEVRASQQVTGMDMRLMPALVARGRIVIEGVDKQPRWLWLVASRGGKDAAGNDTSSSRDNARVNPKDSTFTFDGLSPGAWTLTLATDLDQEFEAVNLTLTRDVSDLVLTFHPAPEAPPDPDAPAEVTTVK